MLKGSRLTVCLRSRVTYARCAVYMHFVQCYPVRCVIPARGTVRIHFAVSKLSIMRSLPSPFAFIASCFYYNLPISRRELDVCPQKRRGIIVFLCTCWKTGNLNCDVKVTRIGWTIMIICRHSRAKERFEFNASYEVFEEREPGSRFHA